MREVNRKLAPLHRTQAFAGALALVGTACRGTSSPGPPDGTSPEVRLESADAATPSDASPDASVDAARGLPPIPPEPLFTNLVVPGFPEAVVSVPNGATSARPLAIVLHGTSDRPDWNCDAWRHMTGARGFVLCPRGDFDPRESTPGDRRFTLRGGAPLRAYVEAATQALAARFAGYVDVERPVAAGFSLGATEIAQLALGDPARFPRVAGLEGGHGVWTAAAISAFAAKGGSRVLFGCGSTWCTNPARAAARRLIAGGVEARVAFAPVGHTNDRPLQEALMRELPWFLDGDPRWAR
jgi:predicted esterase